MEKTTNQRDIVFLDALNSVYKKFKHYKSNKDISVYTYGDFEVKNIPESSGEGDTAFFISENGALIIVDYALISIDIANLRLMESDKKKYVASDERIGRIAGIECFSILAYRACRNDFNKEQTFFTIDISKYFLHDQVSE